LYDPRQHSVRGPAYYSDNVLGLLLNLPRRERLSVRLHPEGFTAGDLFSRAGSLDFDSETITVHREVAPAEGDVVFTYEPRSVPSAVWFTYSHQLPYYSFASPVKLTIEVRSECSGAILARLAALPLRGREPTVPDVVIVSPMPGETFATVPRHGSALMGCAGDAVDGPLDESMRWSIDGASVGSGNGCEFPLGLAPGRHVVRLDVENQAGTRAFAVNEFQRAGWLSPTDGGRIARIATPGNLASIECGSTLTCEAELLDGSLAASLVPSFDWLLSGPGTFGLSGNPVGFRDLAPGSYTLSLRARAYPDACLTPQQSLTVQLRPPYPTVELLEPVPGQMISRGTLVRLRGRASDATEASYPNERLFWRVDGLAVVATGADVQVPADLPPGPHTLVLQARSKFGMLAGRQVPFEILESPPVISIRWPRDGQTVFAEEPLLLDAVSNRLAPQCRWSSNRGEVIAEGPTVTVTGLSPEPHVFSVHLVDSGGSSSAFVRVNVQSAPAPVVHILEPLEGAEWSAGRRILALGTARDGVTGEPLPPEGIQWTVLSNQQTALQGTGDRLVISGLSAGNYSLRLQGTDRRQKPGTEVRHFVVHPEPPPVLVSWSVTPTTTPLYAVDPIVFKAGDAWDVLSPAVMLNPSSYTWDSSLQGRLLVGREGRLCLSPGDHVISLTISGACSSRTLTTAVAVLPTHSPELSISEPAEGFTTTSDQTVRFAASGVDFRGTPLPSSAFFWWSSRAGLVKAGSDVFQSRFPVGTTTVTVSAQDGWGNATGVHRVLAIQRLAPPQVTILEPTGPSPLYAGWPFRLRASASDPLSGTAMPDGSLSWLSDVDGALGAGHDLLATVTTPGLHVLRVSAIGVTGQTAIARVAVQVKTASAPLVNIDTAPVSAWASEPLTLTAHAFDPQDGPLDGAALRWTSGTAEGPVLANGPSVQIPGLVPGIYNRFTATATNRFGLSGSASLDIWGLPPPPPQVAIAAPATAFSTWSEDFVLLSGVGRDFLTRDLADVDLVWRSSLSGALGAGRRLLVQLPEGTHDIELRATDSGGRTATRTVTGIKVRRATPPVVDITAPGTNGSQSYFPDPVTFDGCASDYHGTSLPANALVWRLEPHPAPIGVGTSLVTTTLPPGNLCVSLTATDSAGRASSAKRWLTVIRRPAPETVIASPLVPRPGRRPWCGWRARRAASTASWRRTSA
jgi:hypothetical protein